MELCVIYLQLYIGKNPFTTFILLIFYVTDSLNCLYFCLCNVQALKKTIYLSKRWQKDELLFLFDRFLANFESLIE